MMAGVFLVVALATLSLPGLSTFVSEFLVLVGTFTRYRALAIVATVGIILAALYILLVYQRTMTGPVTAGNERLRDLNAREAWVVAPLVALMFVLGVYPKPVLDVITPAVNATLAQVKAHDPQPTSGVPAAAAPASVPTVAPAAVTTGTVTTGTVDGSSK